MFQLPIHLAKSLQSRPQTMLGTAPGNSRYALISEASLTEEGESQRFALLPLNLGRFTQDEIRPSHRNGEGEFHARMINLPLLSDQEWVSDLRLR